MPRGKRIQKFKLASDARNSVSTHFAQKLTDA